MVHRRRFLRTVGAGCTASLLAGCSDSSGDEERPDDAAESSPDGEDGDASDDGADGDDGDTGDPSENEDGDGSDVDRTELIRITAGGDDLGPEHEEGHFYYEERSGDFDVAVHAMALGGSTGWEKAGIMVRESLGPAAPHLMVRRNPDGDDVYGASPTSVQWRPDLGATNRARDGTMAEWLRVKRSGDRFEIYGSMTGDAWEQFDEFTTDDVALSGDVFVGLAVTGMEEYDEPTVTATFKDLTGLSPAESVDLGEPDNPGETVVRDDVPVVSTAEPERAPSELTLVGELYLPDGVPAAECHFEYRRTSEAEWQRTEPETVDSSGRFTATVPAESRRLYQFRAIADVPDAPTIDGETFTTGATAFRSTPSAGESGEADDSLSAGVSAFGPGDGFADPAPWLDDDTPVIAITEPSVEQLRRAFETPHERLVVFETSGTIDLETTEWSIRRDRCYVAGQTAPSPGITLIRGSLQIAADDCVVQHLRVRPGVAGQDEGWAPTGIHTQDGTENNVVDHCTATWAIDENLTVGGPSSDTTLTNNLAAEGLVNATHPKGIHSYGSLIKDGAENVAMLGNVWAHNVGRNPRLKTGTTSVVVNNVMYHFDEATNLDADAVSAVVGNAYLRVDEGDANVEGGRVYHEDNRSEPDTTMVDGAAEFDTPLLWPGGLEAIPAADVVEHNLRNAGARPADRTDHDRRIVAAVADRSGDRIDDEDEVGGYAQLPVNTRPLEVPDSGTRAWLRERSRAVEADPSE